MWWVCTLSKLVIFQAIVLPLVSNVESRLYPIFEKSRGGPTCYNGIKVLSGQNCRGIFGFRKCVCGFDEDVDHMGICGGIVDYAS